jgi:hypothetical protein
MNLKTVDDDYDDDDNNDDNDTTNFCPRKEIIGNILTLVKPFTKFCYEICKKFWIESFQC